MKTLKSLITLLVFSFIVASSAFAQSNYASQQVTVNVQEINAISVGGSVSLSINTTTAGENPDPIESTSSYNISSNGTDKKITAQLDEDMPEGLTLQSNMSAPRGAQSTGYQTLSSNAVDLCSGVTKVMGSGLQILHKATATLVVAPQTYSRTVTYTITNSN